MATLSTNLSKSRFTAGLQCLKQLWWRVHEPHAPELVPDAAAQANFDRGNRVGAAARAYVPGGTLIELPYRDYEGRIAATADALAAGAPAIYEAAFRGEGVFVSVDILERVASGLGLIEVKSSTRVKDEHLPDAAIQAHVLRACGLDLRRTEIMHLNRACAYPDLSDLFVRTDVSAAIEAMQPRIPSLIAAQAHALRGPLPEVAIGDHCDSPRPCPFHDRCWPVRPDHHVTTLFRSRAKAAALEAAGFVTIDQLAEGLGPNPQAERQRQAVRDNRLIVDPGLARALRAFAPPLAFLDFETIAPAIPVWPGCHPYDMIPVQFSCHVERDGALEHRAWLAEGPEDPRPEFARRLIAACEGARTVVAYNAPFERGCIAATARALPDQAGALDALAARLADPLPVVREHVYHPDFRGSFSLKSVLPALVPGMDYLGLEIGDGTAASIVLERLFFERDTLEAREVERLRGGLERYCAIDTLGMARLVARLREIAGTS